MFLRRLAAVVGLALIVAACESGPGAGGTLEGTDWVLDSYDLDGVLTIAPETVYADAEFGRVRLEGFSGCNEYRGVMRANGRSLLISQLATTLMACGEEAMAFEQRFISLLQESRNYTVRRGRLTIFDGARNSILVFDAAPKNPLLGTWLVESYGVETSTVVGVLPETQLDATFRITTVAGSGGCNSYSATYGTNGNIVRIGPLAVTQAACEQEVMDQEQAFLQALAASTLIESRGPRLNLTDSQGRLRVGLVRPSAVEEPAPSAEASPTATASEAPSESPSPSPSPTPTATPSPSPSPSPSPTPTAAPTAAPSPSPQPTIATCQLTGPDPVVTLQIVYPGSWQTIEEPAELACRYFDPEPIEAPAEGETLVTAVMANAISTPYADAVTAATDPALWTVSRIETPVTGSGTPITCVLAAALVDVNDLAAGDRSYTCLISVETGTVTIKAVGPPADETMPARIAVVSLMTLLSTVEPQVNPQ